jgi:integrase
MRRYGHGSLFQKPGTTCWTIQYYVNGKRLRESTGCAKRADAERILKDRLARITMGEPVGPELSRTTFEDLASILLDAYRVNRHRSIARVEDAIEHLRNFFGGFKARDITGDRITAYIAYRLQSLAANATINRELAALRRACRLAKKAGKLAQLPDFELLRENNARKGFFEPAEFAALLDELPECLKPVIHVAYITGWRIPSELLTRQWRHVDFDGGWLRLEPNETKNSEGRQFPLTPELRLVLEAQRRATDELEKAIGQTIPFVFHRDGARIRDFRGAWAGALKRAGLSASLIPHDFRRSAVRNLIRAGVSQTEAMKLTGHLTPEVFRRYAIVDETMLREAGQKLAAHHASENRTFAMTPGTIERMAVAVSAAVKNGANSAPIPAPEG